MNNFIRGFGDELVKAAAFGAIKGIGKFLVKNPLVGMGAATTLGATALAARQGYKRGRHGSETAQYLPAHYDPIARRAQASRTAYTNFSQLFDRKPTVEELDRLHRNYSEKAFKR